MAVCKGAGKCAVILLLIALWTNQASCTHDCSIIQVSDLGSTDDDPGLIASTFTSSAEVSDPTVLVMDYQIVCLAQGAEQDSWRSVSLVVNYTHNGANRTSQFQFECDDSNWTATVNGSAQYIRTEPPDASFDTTIRTDCAMCVDPRQLSSADNNSQHCLACHETCSQGLQRCTSDSENSCCSYFNDGQCVSNCPNNSLPNIESVCCPEGYEGVNCTQDIDECSNGTDTCMNSGVCNNTIGGFECICQNGYSGARCENDVNECASDPCLNGTCDNLLGTYRCDCLPGYTGSNCEIEINECEEQPCLNEGICIDSVNLFSCNCTDGWTGQMCDVCALEGCMDCTTDAERGSRAVCVTCQAGYTLVPSSGTCETLPQSSGLSAGVIAGIVVAVLFGIIMVVILVALMVTILYVHKRNKASSAFRDNNVQADKKSSVQVMKNPVYLAPDSVEEVDSRIKIEDDDHLVVNRAALEFEEDSDES